MKLADLKEKLAQLDKRLPVRTVGMLPSEAFFCRVVELPEGTQTADIGGFAQLQLEATAPFPIENLAWGYLQGNPGRIFIYASTTDRAGAGIIGGLESLWHAFPCFLPFCLATSPAEDIVRLCIVGRSASAIWFKAGDSTPSRVQSLLLPEDMPLAGNENLLKARPALIAGLGSAATHKIEDGIWTLDHTSTRSEDKVTFKLRHVTGSGNQARSVERDIAGDALWNADARGRTFAAVTRKERRNNYVAWIAFAAAGWTGAALLLASIVLISISAATGMYHASARKHLAEVEVLQNKADFATNLESVTEREMKPFAMLAAANAKRPAGLFYERASSSDWNVLRIEGQAQRSDQIQGYIEALSKDPVVRTVRTLRTATSSGRSSFDIEIVFNVLEDITTSK